MRIVDIKDVLGISFLVLLDFAVSTHEKNVDTLKNAVELKLFERPN